MRRYLLSIGMVLLGLGIYSCDSSDNKVSEPETPQITDKYWKLIEIEGQAVNVSEGWIKEPHLQLHTNENQMTGNGGCNSFFSTFELDLNQGLEFGQIGITEMACLDMALEQQFTQTLRLVETYSIHNDTLTLNGTNQQGLAILKWVKK